MTKKKLIELIEGMFPADSSDENTANQGKELLVRSIQESGWDWRSLPVQVLDKYAQLCIENQPVLFNLNLIEDDD